MHTINTSLAIVGHCPGEIKISKCKCMVNWKDFPYNSALFGLVI